MAAARLYPETLEERLIYWSIVSTWGFWALGALYVLAPVLGWSLVGLWVVRYTGRARDNQVVSGRVPWECMLWIVFMVLMLAALLVGHMDYRLGFAQMLKSTFGWMKGWALLAVFAFIGATLRVRPALIYRASNHLGAQTLLMAPLFVLAAQLHLPKYLYISPLQVIGGPGPEFFKVALYSLGESGEARFGFYAPWAPGAALIACVAFVLAMYDKDKLWRGIGIVSSLIVCALSQSRMAFVAIPAVCALIAIFANLTRPISYWPLLTAVLCSIPFIDTILGTIEDMRNKFSGARAASSRVRGTLQSIAIHRWNTEAPIWGHGTVERGPHLVEYMPIGSHHTWFGLLYVKGIVGVVALALPLAVSLVCAVVKAQSDRVARAALGVLLVLITFSFGENLEILVYLYWPGVIVMGIAMKRRTVTPFNRYLAGVGQKTRGAAA